MKKKKYWNGTLLKESCYFNKIVLLYLPGHSVYILGNNFFFQIVPIFWFESIKNIILLKRKKRTNIVKYILYRNIYFIICVMLRITYSFLICNIHFISKYFFSYSKLLLYRGCCIFFSCCKRFLVFRSY